MWCGLQDSVEGLLEEGVDVNKEHGTLLPLHSACNVGDVEIVKLLLEHDANVSYHNAKKPAKKNVITWDKRALTSLEY